MQVLAIAAGIGEREVVAQRHEHFGRAVGAWDFERSKTYRQYTDDGE
jgi:hypothetical protein